MKAERLAFLPLALLVWSAPLAAQNDDNRPLPPARALPQATVTATATAYAQEPPLAPGDAIRLHFWQEPQFSGDFPVDERGLVTLPLLGVRQVTHWPSDQVKAQLIAEYARQLRDQPAQVTMLRRVAVIGAVANPGLYHVDPTMRIGDVLALAGGPTQEAKLNRATVVRGGAAVTSSLDDAVFLNGFRSGDQIVVPRRSWIERNAAILIGATLSGLAIVLRR